MHWAVIRNLESDKNVAVLVHDEVDARLVYKIRPADALLQKSLDIFSERSVVVQEEDEEHGFMKRRRVLREDADFLTHFIDRTIQHPYEVRSMSSSEDESSADSVADRVYDDQVSFQEAAGV